MKKKSHGLRLFISVLGLCCSVIRSSMAADDYSWMRGVNYVPSYAQNDVQIWMEYDPKVIDRELGYAEKLKLNTVRVFLNEAVYEKQSDKFMADFESFVSLCHKHKIKVMPVLFDSCFDPQVVDVNNYRGKNWIPSPGFGRLGNEDWPALEKFIRAVVGAYRHDNRIVLWDVMNEPESTGEWGKPEGKDRIVGFVRRALQRVKDEKPVQPLGIGWASSANITNAADLSDVLIIHNYAGPSGTGGDIRNIKAMDKSMNKPVILNEFVGRPQQRIEDVLPVVAKEKIGWCFWELMIGGTQFAQGKIPYQGHIYPDGSCYSMKEVAAILNPEGIMGDAEEIARKAGFSLSVKAPQAFTEESITFSPCWMRWNGEGPAGKRLWYANDAGQKAVKEVTGTSIELVLKHGPDCGIAAVTVDGKPAEVAEIDTYAKDVDWNGRTVAAQNLPAGKHKVAVMVTGRKAGPSSNCYVQIVDVTGSTDRRWPGAKAWGWYNKQPWIVGCNFLPSTAVNDVEMWQAETFDPKTIDRELGWAQDLGFNSVRVFLNYVVWKADPKGFKKRFSQFLKIADRHGISVMPIFFDDCAFAGREPKVGRQDDPVPGVHNSGWVPSPGKSRVMDRTCWPDLENYVKDMVGSFRKDRRIIIWDLYNEPANDGMGEKSLPLMEAAFAWAREMQPVQPLTVGAWANFHDPLQRRMMELSDVVSFHGYDPRGGIEAKMQVCREYGRPVLCTEWLLRQGNNRVETLLPMFRERQIGCYNWGLVAGRTQTYMQAGSPKGSPEPAVWQHDLFRRDGTPYKADEIAIIKQMTGRLKVSSAQDNYKGWKTHRLSNGLIELQIIPQLGGRIMQFSMGDKQFLWVNPELAGRAPSASGLGPNGEWLNYGGDKLWPAPQGWDHAEQWPGPPDAVLDGGAYAMKVLSAGAGQASVLLTSGQDQRSGIQFSRVITIYKESTRVSFAATMRNVDNKPRRWGIWAHTQLNGGKRDGSGFNDALNAWCPINPHSRFEKGYAVIFGDAQNPSYQPDAARGLMRVQYKYRVGKVGLDSPGGWVATVDGESGKALVQRFIFEKGRDYPEDSSVEFWLNGLGSFKAWGKDNVMPDDPIKNPYVFESEILSPRAQLQPGEHFTWKYDWYSTAIGSGQTEVVDCTAAGVVAEPLRVKVEEGSLRLTGRFGVFVHGSLTAEFLDKQGEVVARMELARGISPLIPLVLDRTLQRPANAVTAELVIKDSSGMAVGRLGAAVNLEIGR